MSETPPTTKPNSLWIVGLLYGLLLTVFGVFAANAGHGTYVLIGIFSAPFGLLGTRASFLGAIILWLMMGLLLGAFRKKLFLLAIVTHYVGIALLLNTDSFGDWQYFEQALESNATSIFLGLAIYIGGQLAMWLRYAMSSTEATSESVLR